MTNRHFQKKQIVMRQKKFLAISVCRKAFPALIQLVKDAKSKAQEAKLVFVTRNRYSIQSSYNVDGQFK